MDDYTLGRAAYLALLLMAVAGWAFVEFRQRMGQALRFAAAWGLLFLGVAAGYGLWNDIQRQSPVRQMVTAEGEVELPRAADGHFYAELMIGDVPVFFMADTGATNMVLAPADAARLGIDTGSLTFMGEASTANGVVRTARVNLKETVLGPFRDDGLVAYVTDGAMDISLLGMDYLRRFSIRIEGDRMVLTR